MLTPFTVNFLEQLKRALTQFSNTKTVTSILLFWNGYLLQTFPPSNLTLFPDDKRGPVCGSLIPQSIMNGFKDQKRLSSVQGSRGLARQ